LSGSGATIAAIDDAYRGAAIPESSVMRIRV
jgi:hypothetical protein